MFSLARVAKYWVSVPQSTVMSATVPDARRRDVAVPATPEAICDALSWSLSSVPFHRIELMDALFVGTTYTRPAPVLTVMLVLVAVSDKAPDVAPVVAQAFAVSASAASES